MPNLKVLHLQRQRLMKKESYKFCSDTVTELSVSMKNVSWDSLNIIHHILLKKGKWFLVEHFIFFVFL